MTTQANETPTTGQNHNLRLVLETEDRSKPIRIERKGNDIFFVTPDSEVVAALIQMAPALQVAVA